jgi:hypothetical protein
MPDTLRSMSNVYIERRDEKYVAIQNKQVIAMTQTQGQAIDVAKMVRPNDNVLAERVRDTKVGHRDKWRAV